MKKVLYWVLVLAVISGCSDSKSPVSSPSVEGDNVTNWYAGVGQFNGSLDFGVVSDEKTKILTVTIKNVGDSSLIGPVTISGNDFTLAYQNCTSVLPGKTCSAKIGFNSQGKLNQNYSASLQLGEQSAQVTAVVDLPSPPTELQALISGTPVSALEFGTLKFDQSVMKTVVITNKGKDKGPWVVGQSGNGFVVSYDTCSGKALLPTKSCQLKVSLSGAGKSGEITDILTFGNLELPMTALVKNLPTVALEESDVKLLVNSQVANPGAVDLGTWNLRQTKILNLYLKNEGTDKGVIEEPEIPLDLQIAFNNCEPGKILNPKATCLMKLVASPQSKGVRSSPLVLQGQNYNFQSIVREPNDKIFCPMDNAESSYITWSGSSYSDCVIEECSPEYHLIDNACDPDVISCPVDNGQGLQSWTGNEYGNCVLDTCDTNYHEVSGACIPNDQSCDIDHGTGNQSWLGNEWSQCQVVDCDSTYHTEDELTCVSDTRSCFIANGTGSQTWNGASWNTCQVQTCTTANYYKNVDNNACELGIVTNGPSRNWADGTYATSCKGYRNPSAGKIYQGSTGSGSYTIQPVGSSAYTAYCDQVTDNGGWTLNFRGDVSLNFNTTASQVINQILPIVPQRL